MSMFPPLSTTKLNTQVRKHALLALATIAAACLCVPSAGASVARSSITPISSSSVSGSQSASVTTTAIGHNRVPTRGHGGGHGGGHSGGHSSGHSRSGSSEQRHSSSGYVGSSYSSYSDDDDYKAKDKLEDLALFIVGGLGLYCLVKEDETEIV